MMVLEKNPEKIGDPAGTKTWPQQVIPKMYGVGVMCKNPASTECNSLVFRVFKSLAGKPAPITIYNGYGVGNFVPKDPTRPDDA
jgi:hypothetical protein